MITSSSLQKFPGLFIKQAFSAEHKKMQQKMTELLNNQYFEQFGILVYLVSYAQIFVIFLMMVLTFIPKP